MASRVLPHLDLIVLAVALPLFAIAGLPMLGYAAVAGAWLLQALIETLAMQRARELRDRRTALGALAGTFIARLALTIVAVLAAGISDKDAGVAAGVLAVVLFTLHLSSYLFIPPIERIRG